jgi:CO/xanthine dehydrogenase FAD-binding subunit
LDTIGVDPHGWIHLGPLVTHNHVAVSPLIVENAFALARLLGRVRHDSQSGTVAGNLITASRRTTPSRPSWRWAPSWAALATLGEAHSAGRVLHRRAPP